MTTTTPRVRDFTTEQRLQVEVAAGDAFEFLLSLYLLGDEENEVEFEVGADWFEAVRHRAGDDLVAGLARYGDWSVWMTLLGEAHEMGAPYTVEHLIAHLETMDPVALRTERVAVGTCHASQKVEEADRRALVEGDAGTLSRAAEWCEKCPGLIELLRLPADDTRTTLVELLRGFAGADLVPAEVAATLQRDAEHKRSLARRLDPERLVEQATQGIAVVARPGLDRVVLVPSVAIRPWVIVAEKGTARILCYSVDESILTADPDAPPAWLVQFYKALGDERRLTILKRLAEGPASFAELVELLDLAKSTVHHHIRQLRQAGVVRVTVGEDKEYSLRTGTVPEAARLLEGFLGTISDNS